MLEMWASPTPTQAAPASFRLTRRSGRMIVLPFMLMAGLAHAVAAQTTRAPASPAATGPGSTSKTESLSATEAANTLALLRDDKRRAELMTTLEAIAKAAPAATAPEPAATPAMTPAMTPAETLAAGPLAATGAVAPAATPVPPAGSTAPPTAPVAVAAATAPVAVAAATPAAKPEALTTAIAPDSIGAQLATRMAVLLGAYVQQLANSVQAVNDLPLLGRWLSSQANDPAARAEALDAARMLLMVIAAGLAVEWLVRRLFRRLRKAVIAWSPRDFVADPSAPDTHASEVRRRRFERIITSVKLLPYLLARLLIDLVPIAVFVGTVTLLLGTVFMPTAQTGLIVLQAAQAYAFVRVVFAATAFLVSPKPPRLLPLSEWAAAFVTRWVRRLTIIAATGSALASIGLSFGMYRTAQLAILKLFALVVHLCLVVAVLQARAPVAHRLRAHRGATGLWARVCNGLAGVWHWFAIFWIVAAWLVWAVEIRNGYERLLTFFGATIAIVVAARLLAVLILGGLDRVRARLSNEGFADRAGVYYPVLRFVISAAIWIATGIALLETWGLPVTFWLTAGGLGGRVFDAGFTVVVAVLLAVAAWEGVNAAVARRLAALAETSQLARAGRLRTLLPLMRTALFVTIVLVVGMIALSAIGVNIAPLIAGASVIGIAVGFGSQKLVQDLITGLFLLLENSMQVGDIVTVASMTGTVEALSIRTIRLRATDGSVYLIPFSAVTTVTNQTRDYSYAVLDISIGLNEEPGPIETVLREVAAEMQADPAWQSIVLDTLDVMGVDKLTDTAWIMRVRIKTQPSSRWAVTRELNRRIKIRFDESAIESPFTSHRSLSRETAPAVATVPVEQGEAA